MALFQNAEKIDFKLEQIYDLLPNPQPTTLQEWGDFHRIDANKIQEKQMALSLTNQSEANYMRFQRGKKLYSKIKRNEPWFSNYLAQSCPVTAYSSYFHVFSHLDMVFSDKGFEKDLKLEKPEYIKNVTNSFNEILSTKELKMPWSKIQHRAVACYTVKAIDFSRVIDITLITLLRELSMNEGRFWTDQSHAERLQSLMGYVESIARSRNILEDCGTILGEAFDKRTSQWSIAQRLHYFHFHNPVATKNHPIPFCARMGGCGIQYYKISTQDLKVLTADWSSKEVKLGRDVSRNKGTNHREITDETVLSSIYPPKRTPNHTDTFNPIKDRKNIKAKKPATIKPSIPHPPINGNRG